MFVFLFILKYVSVEIVCKKKKKEKKEKKKDPSQDSE